MSLLRIVATSLVKPAMTMARTSISQQPSVASMAMARLHHTMVTPSVAVTKPAPDFKGQAVVDGQFKEIKLADYAGKYLVLFFYPLDL